jgi:Peptidase family M48
MAFVRRFAGFGALVCLCIFEQPARAQQGCVSPSQFPTAEGPNIFTPQQEVELGEVLAEQLQKNFRVIEDDALTAYARQVADRILRQFPPTQLHFQVFLIDLPEANAFSLPGGRIYLSRKLIGFLHSEDELAGLLGHEMGHILTHQGAVDMTRNLHLILRVDRVGDQRDIFEKYNQFLENLAKNEKAQEEMIEEEEPNQYQADQVALYVLSNAGYAPQALLNLWDRFAQTKGKTGNWFSNLFGITKPAERRLREMRKAYSGLPVSCHLGTPSAPSPPFVAWQTAVVGYSGLGRKEVVHDVVARIVMDPPLRGDITNLRFSLDGRYVLAQDESSIFLLTREPFEVLFRIDARDAHHAQFTPDSKSVVFYTNGLRVEKWSIADEKQTFVHEMVILGGCWQTLLSPDGKYLACLDGEWNLSVYDVASDASVFQKKQEFQWVVGSIDRFLLQIGRLAGITEPEWVHMGYSPDARYLVVAKKSKAVAVDLTTRSEIAMPGGLKDLLGAGFTFLGPDRVIGVNSSDSKKSGVAGFPSGERISELTLGHQSLEAVARGDYVLVRPMQFYPVGVLNLLTQNVVLASKAPAMDLYDQTFVTEQRGGELELKNLSSRQTLAKAYLPLSPLGRLRAAAVSPDFKWLAVSERTRGAVWNVTTGQRAFFTRGFNGAYIDADQAVYADFPKFEKVERTIARMDLSTLQVTPATSISEDPTRQAAKFLVIWKHSPDGRHKDEYLFLEVRDVRNDSVLWTASFPKEMPAIETSDPEDIMTWKWPLHGPEAKEQLKQDPNLRKRVASMKDREEDYLLVAVDEATGKTLGRVAVDTGKRSFRIRQAQAAGDWLFITDYENRTLIYSLSSGEEKDRVFGSPLAFAPATGLLATENDPGNLTLYRLPSADKVDRFLFSSRISLARFGPDGKRLFVLTANQATYILDVSRLASSPQTATASH